jgi:hypothetical protein
LSDVVIEILSGIVRVGLESLSLRSSKVLDTLVSLEMELNPVSFTLVVNPLESVGRITVHSSETIRGTSVREQDSHLERERENKVKQKVTPSHLEYRKPIFFVQDLFECVLLLDEQIREFEKGNPRTC